MEVHPSARRHQVPDADISHAYEHAIAWVELGDDPCRYLVAGPDRAGILLELVVVELPDTVLVIHAMALRRSPDTNYSETNHHDEENLRTHSKR